MGKDFGKKTGFSFSRPSKVDPQTLSQMIRERAYHIWETKGCPHGNDFDNWLQAEKEIKAKLRR